MYINNIVRKSRIRFMVTNQENFSVDVAIVPSIVLPITPANSSEARSALENQFASKKLRLAPVGNYMNTGSLVYDIDYAAYYGLAGEYLSSSLYSSVRGSMPSNIIYLNIICASATGDTFSGGIQYVWEESDYIQFYAPAQVLDST
jgi:hypothetical protein